MPGVRPPSDALDDEALIQKIEAQVQKNNDRMAELQKIGAAPETPDHGDLLGHAGRAKSGFADDDAIVKMTHAGYSDMHRNKAGDWVAKGPDGRWYGDSEGPAAFVERHLGDVPGLVGMAAGAPAGALVGAIPGGMAGAAGGSASGGFTGGVAGTAVGSAIGAGVGAAAGAGAGAAGGEALRQYLGQKLGVRDKPIDMGDVATQGILGAIGEGAFQGGAKVAKMIPVPAQAAKLLLGANRAAQGQGGNVADLIAQIADRYGVQPLKKTTAAVAGAISGAGKDAAERVIERPSQMLAAGDDIAGKAKKAGDYLNFQDRVYGADVGDARNAFRLDHGDKVVDTSKLLEKNASALDRYSPNAYGSGPLSPEDEQFLQQLQNKEYVTPQMDPVYGVQTGAKPEQTLGSLQRTADQLDKDVGPANWKRAAEDKPVQRTKAYISEAKSQRHDIKQILHMEDPNLARADAQYSSFARDAEPVANLSAPLKQEGEYNALAKSIANGTDNEKVSAASRVLGPSMDDLKDTGMARRFDKGGLGEYFNPLTPRRAFQFGLGASGIAASQSGNDTVQKAGLMLDTLALGMEPKLIKNLLATGAITAPMAAEALRRAGTYKGAQSIWSLFNQEKNDGSKD